MPRRGAAVPPRLGSFSVWLDSVVTQCVAHLQEFRTRGIRHDSLPPSSCDQHPAAWGNVAVQAATGQYERTGRTGLRRWEIMARFLWAHTHALEEL